jgi:hypothetical protein
MGILPLLSSAASTADRCAPDRVAGTEAAVAQEVGPKGKPFVVCVGHVDKVAGKLVGYQVVVGCGMMAGQRVARVNESRYEKALNGERV